MLALAPRLSPAVARARTDVVAALLVALVAASATWFVDEWGTRRGLAPAACVIALLWLATTRRTPLALAVFLVYVGALDGYAKLSTGSAPVTLIRDALLFAIAIGALIRAQASGTRLRLPPLTPWVLVFAAIVLAQLANPHAGTLVHSLAGVRQHLEFVPLFFLTFAFVRSKQALRWYVVLLALVAAANGVAGYAQFRMTPEQLAAWGPGYAERVLGEGRFTEAGRNFFTGVEGQQRTRPFGLGSDAGSGGMMGALALGAAIALATRITRLRRLLFAVALAIAATVAIVTSQGRSAVVAGVLVVLGYATLTATSGRQARTVAALAVTALVAALVAQAFVSSVGSDQFRYADLSTGRILRTTQEARGASLASIPEQVVDYPFGAGLAVAGAASGVGGGTDLTGAVDAENWFSFQIVELGVPGMLVLLGLTLTLLWLAVTRVRREPDAEVRVLLAALLAPLFALAALYFVGGGLTSAAPMGPYLWASAGLVSYWLIARRSA